MPGSVLACSWPTGRLFFLYTLRLRFSLIQKQLQDAEIDGGQPVEVGDLDTFVDLVDAVVDDSEFDNLGPGWRDKARIRGAAPG